MKRKKDRKPKLIIKTRNGGCTKLYVNGKWQRKVTDIDFHWYVGNDGIIIECEYDKMKLDKNGYPIVKDNELVKEKHIVRIWMMNNCNLITCRYNEDGKCTNEEKRKECVRVSKAVLLIDDLVDIEVPDNQLCEKKNPLNICKTNPDCEFDPEHCIFSVDCTVFDDLPNRIYMCGRDKCKYQK